MNAIAQRAIDAGRDYVTPGDLLALISEGLDLTQLRLDALGCLANVAGVGIEDRSAFAFVAWEGTKMDSGAEPQ